MSRNKLNRTKPTTSPETTEEVVVSETVVETPVETTVAEEPAPVVTVEPKPAPKPKGPQPTDAIKAALDEYVANMGPSVQVTEQSGIKSQRRLRSALIVALTNKDLSQSLANANYILDYFHSNKEGLFKELKIFRFFNRAGFLNKAELAEYETLLTMLINTADPSSRRTMARALDWNAFERKMMPQRNGAISRTLKRLYGIN